MPALRIVHEIISSPRLKTLSPALPLRKGGYSRGTAAHFAEIRRLFHAQSLEVCLPQRSFILRLMISRIPTGRFIFKLIIVLELGNMLQYLFHGLTLAVKPLLPDLFLDRPQH